MELLFEGNAMPNARGFDNAQKRYDAMTPKEEEFCEEEITYKRFEMFRKRLHEDPREWLGGSMTEADSCDIGQLVVLFSKEGSLTAEVGKLVVNMVVKNCMPPDDEVIAELRNDRDVASALD